MSRQRIRRERAFSMIELLVVISIITLLVALLLPVLEAARIGSQQSQSVANTRQITLALHAYAQDFDSSLPCCRFWLPSQPNPPYTWPIGQPWSSLIYEKGYITDVRVYWSPARELAWLDKNVMMADKYNLAWLRIGYGVNGAIMTEERKDPRHPLRLDGPTNPPASSHALMAEAYDPVWYDTLGVDGFYAVGVNFNLYDQRGKIVRSYMDGHAAVRGGQDLDWQVTGNRQGNWLSTLTREPWYQ